MSDQSTQTEISQEAAHTPGPWSVFEGHRTNDWPGIEAACGQSIVVYGIADYCEDAGVRGRHMGEVHANARLIAAAPDMLAVLRLAEEFIANGVECGFIRMPDVSTPDLAHHTLPAIRAAIAKVERGS